MKNNLITKVVNLYQEKTSEKELEILLKKKCENLNLKQKAFTSLEEVFSECSEEKNFLCGFKREEIQTIFDGFKYQIEQRYTSAIISIRIGLYVEDKDKVYLDNIERIGYYELETDFNGEILDDWFIIEKEKYLKDVEIISHFQTMNEKLPPEYLQVNQIQYEFVSYISFIGTLFVSKQFEDVGRFTKSANKYLEENKNSIFQKDYLKASKSFLKIIKNYILENNLISEKLKKELTEK